MENGMRLRYSCKFPGCTSKYFSPITQEGYKNKRFFKFPANESVRAEWLKACNINSTDAFQNMYVCDEHFHLQDYLNYHTKMLLHVAVPKKLSADEIASLRFSLTEKENYIDHDYTNTSTFNYEHNDFSFLMEDNRARVAIRKIESPCMLKYKSVLAKILILKNTLKGVGDQMEKIKQLYEEGKFKMMEKELSTLPKGLIDLNLKIAPQKPTLKIWNLDDEIRAIWLYVRMPHLFKYFSAIFHFPSEYKLGHLLSQIPFDTGLNSTITEQLKIQNEKLTGFERTCLLLINDLKLNEEINYNEHQQFMFGYEDLGHHNTNTKMANHALVFMIRGIKRSWKQVVAYYFVSEPFKPEIFINIVVRIINDLHEIGFKILATVCDPKPKYIKSLKMLAGEHVFFHVNYSPPVYTIYDAHGLLKDTRDVLLHCNIEYEEGKTAKFAYIEKAFNLDRERRTYSQLPKIKPEYFNFKNNRIKRDSSIAACQLSSSVACSIETWICLEELPEEAIHTAEFAAYMESIFNSLNGSTSEDPVAIWLHFLEKVSNWKFLDKNTNVDITNKYSIIEGWITTVKSIMRLWKKFRQGRLVLPLKLFNKNPLNSFLDTICGHYEFPTCYQFVNTFKADIIQNFSTNADESNEHKCDPLLNLRDFLVNPVPCEDKKTLKIDIDLAMRDQYEAIAYVAGYILRQIQFTEYCKVCSDNIFSMGHLPYESKFDITLYATDQVIKLIDTVKQLLYSFLNSNAHLKVPLEISFKTIHKEELNVKFCPLHTYETYIIDQSVNIYIYEWLEQRKR